MSVVVPIRNTFAMDIPYNGCNSQDFKPLDNLTKID